MAAGAPVVRLARVTKRFGVRLAVDGVDLDIPPGVCFGLLGPNGAGKTTTLRMIYGVTRPTGGVVEVFGLDVTRHARKIRSRLGVTLQQNVLIEALSARENLLVFGRYHLLRDPELSRRAEELIDFLDLGAYARVPVRQLSGGFQRRVAIALSLMNRPALLVLDEPTTGLDPAVRLAVWGHVRALRARGTTVLVTTHYMDEAERLCDRVAIMAGGRVVAEGPPRALIARHAAAEALEIECAAGEEAALLAGAAGVRAQLRAGDRLVVCLDDATALADAIRHRDGGEGRALVVRPANLEDVFLALTGTSLGGDP